MHANLWAQWSLSALKNIGEAYKTVVNNLRKIHQNHRELPAINFFLFGMGDQKKFIYKDGTLTDVLEGDTLFHWTIKKRIIIPSEYAVYIKTKEKKEVII